MAGKRLWGAVVLGWSILGLIESTKAFVFWRTVGKPHSWAYVLISNMPWWLLWAALTPVAAALARRFPLDGRRRLAHLGVHAIAGTLLVFTHLWTAGALYYVTTGGTGATSARRQVFSLIASYSVTDLVAYVAIVVGCWALDYSTRLREARLHAAESEAKAAKLQLGLAEARLQALRMELNPHFLFNAMNSISGLVRRRDNAAAVEMIARLSELLNATLGRQMPPEIPLRDELHLLRRFIEIELVRFGDRLSVSVDVEPSVLQARVPPLFLQPLVENAIRHGVSQLPGPAEIRIQVTRDDDWVDVAVTDTGVGLPRAPSPLPREGVGLSNTRARLLELYGSVASLLLTPAAGGGAVVRVRLPYTSADDRTYVTADADA